MAAISSTSSGGNWSATSTWVGGVVPTVSDSVTIVAGATVTVDGNYSVGAETVGTGAGTDGGLVILGTLNFNVAASRTLTMRGTLTVGATGFLDISNAGARIADSVKIDIVLNDSSALSTGKYCSRVKPGGKVRMMSAQRTRNATLTSAAAAASTSILVNDATGWAASDIIILGATGATSTQTDERTISGTPTNNGNGTWTVNLSAALTNAHAAGGKVGNFTSNITIRPSGTSQPCPFQIAISNTSAANSIFMQDVAFSNMGSGSSWVSQGTTPDFAGALGFNDTATVAGKVQEISGLAFYNSRTASIAKYFGNAVPFEIKDICIASSGNLNAFYQADQSGLIVTRSVVYRAAAYATGGYGLGGVGWTWNDCVFTGANNICFGGTAFNNDIHNNSWVHHGTTLLAYSLSGRMTWNGGYIGVSSPACSGTQTATMGVTQCQAEFISSQMPSALVFSARTSFGSEALANLKVTNKNADVTQHEYYTRYGNLIRDNSLVYRGTSTHRLEPVEANAPATRAIQFLALSGSAYRIVGYLRYDANLTGATKPSVTISGLGITPVSYTMTGAADQWEKFDLTVTQTSGAAGNLTLTLSAQSASVSPVPKVYMSGIIDSPYVQFIRHYGFNFDTNIFRTVNPNIVASEATAISYTGLAWASNTLTVSADRTPQEIYDWHEAYCAANLLTSFITGTPANMSIAGNLTLNNAKILGAGSVINCGSNTYSRVGTGDTDHVVVDASGRNVKIKVPSLIDGTRVQIYNVTDSAQVDNSVVAGGAGYVLRAIYSADKTYRLRATYAGKAPLQSTGIFGNGGLTFLDAQLADATYVTNGIDGSTVTEFAADYPNVQVDVTDPDGVTTLPRLYAWFRVLETTSSGIANFFGGISAADIANYQINGAVLDLSFDNRNTALLTISGGYITKSGGALALVAAGTVGSIYFDSGRAYTSTASVPSAAVVASAVRTELATELARVDVAISSRNAVAPDNTTIATINTKVQTLNNAPAAATVATAVRTELATELARVDATISSRATQASVNSIPTSPLLASNYIAPDNAGIAAIKAKTDTLNNAPAAATVATAVRTEISTELAQISDIAAININKQVTDPATGVLTVFQSDSTTPRLTAQLYEDVAQTQPYRGKGANVRGKLS
jgi:hypothetical protein